MKTIIQSQQFRCIAAAGILAACAVSFSSVAAAADEPGASKINIRYGDLNLANAQGAKVLYERINRAAYAVCQSFGRDGNDNADPLGLQDCRKKIIADAVTKIGKLSLFAVYNARNTTPLPATIVTAQR